MKTFTLETSRLLLRPFCQEDAADLHAILGDEETMRFSEPPYTLAQTEAFLTSFCIRRRGAVAAVHRESGKLIGYMLFNSISADVYEMGWFFNRRIWGQGYAYEACKALIHHAFTRLNAHKIIAETIDPVNSVRLMKKLGMREEGIQRQQLRDNAGHWADLHLYGLLAEDWP